MGTDWISERVPAPLLSASLWCQHCLDRTPVHMIWFNVWLNANDKLTVGQMVCDECLVPAVVKLDAAKWRRKFLGQEVTMVQTQML